MGFFIEENELDKKYKTLIRVISRYDRIDDMDREFLLKYVIGVRDGKQNNVFWIWFFK